MALDTRDKRFSMMGNEHPVPDGSVDKGDRYQRLGLYRFDYGWVLQEFLRAFVVEIKTQHSVEVER